MKTRLIFLKLIYLFFLNSVFAQNFSVSGEVLRHNGDPIPNVTVTCSNGDSTLSDQNGFFVFSDLMGGNDYQISASYESNFFEDLTVLDAAYSRYMLLEIIVPSLSQSLAADIDQSGLYSSLDYIRLRNAVIGLENPSVGSLVEDHPWRFFSSGVDSIFNFTNLEIGINIEELSADLNNLKLIGIKSGDIAFEEDHIPPPPSAPTPLFYIPDMALEEGEEVVIPIKIRDMDGILGWQHAVTWDTSYLEFMNHTGSVDFVEISPNEENVENGLSKMMGINVLIEPIEDDSTIYSIRFKALQDATSLSGIIDFDSLAISNQMVYVENISFYLLDTEFTIGDPDLTTTDDLANSVSFKITPNPTVDYVHFSIQLNQSRTAIVSLFDSFGSLIKQQSYNERFIDGEMNIDFLPKGIYYLQVQTSLGIKNQSFIKL